MSRLGKPATLPLDCMDFYHYSSSSWVQSMLPSHQKDCHASIMQATQFLAAF